MHTAPVTQNVGRSANVTLDRIQERKEFIVSLYVAGMTKRTILEQVNLMSGVKEWGQLSSIRSIERTIAEHFIDNEVMSLEELRSHQAGMREAAFAQQEKLIEMASLHLLKKKDWFPFEYVDALYKLAKMRQQMIDNRGWNYSRLPMKRMEQCGFPKPRRTNWKQAWRSYAVLAKYRAMKEAQKSCG
jgi:hypothetical protein